MTWRPNRLLISYISRTVPTIFAYIWGYKSPRGTNLKLDKGQIMQIDSLSRSSFHPLVMVFWKMPKKPQRKYLGTFQNQILKMILKNHKHVTKDKRLEFIFCKWNRLQPCHLRFSGGVAIQFWRPQYSPLKIFISSHKSDFWGRFD